MVANLLDLIWGILDTLIKGLGYLLGFEPDNMTLREQQALGAFLLAFIPTATYESLKRFRFLRCIFIKSACAEGTWIEKIRRDDKCYVTMVTIKRRLISNDYYASGETVEFLTDEFNRPSVYATFKSDSLHFDENHETILTFNYSSSFTNLSENRTGIAKYVFPNMAKSAATGWFVGVLDGNGAVHNKIEKYTLDLQRITIMDWLGKSIKNKDAIRSASNWKLYLAWCAYKEISSNE